VKRLLPLVFMCLVLSSGARAQQTGPNAPATKEDIEAYLQVMHAHEMMANMMDAMIKPMHQMIHEQYLKNKDKLPPDFEEHMNQLMDDMMKNMPFDEMTQAMVPAYQKYLTKGDVAALVAFYSTATGQKILKQLPAIMAESMQDAMPIMQKYMDTMRQRMEQEVGQMSQQTPTKPSKNPTATQN
jgi:hypothetical protein